MEKDLKVKIEKHLYQIKTFFRGRGNFMISRLERES